MKRNKIKALALAIAIFPLAIQASLDPALALDEDENAEAAETPEEPALRKAKLFGTRPNVLDVSISPDGQNIVTVNAGPGVSSYAMWTQMGENSMDKITATDGRPQQLRWCEFVANDRLLCSVDIIRKGSLGLLSFNRKISMDLDGKNLQVLGEKGSSYDTSIRQSGGFIIDWLDNDGKVLMAQEFVPEARSDTRVVRKKDGLGVVELDTRTNKTKIVESPKDGISGFWGDGTNGIRMIAWADTTTSGYLSGITTLKYRKQDSREWLDFSVIDESKEDYFWPLAIDNKGNKVFGLQKKDGREALFSISLDGNFTTELVYAHPKVDIDGIVRFGQGGRVVGVRFAEDTRKVDYFDPYLKKLADQLSKALPNLPVITFHDASLDEKKLLISARSDNDPGRYYLFDKDSMQLAEILLRIPWLEKEPLSRVEAIHYPAKDGTSIPGFLTLPPGMSRDDARNLPAIVMPHGGPSSRDYREYDWLAQYFASVGFAVLQPNYRGSSGYGEEWYQENGFRSWKTAIGDINDGARWMASQGIADKNNMAIVGWSYGGYAALQSGVAEPGLFKAIAAIAPVTDLASLVKDSENYTNHRLVEKFVGSGAHVSEGSPAKHADAITAPVILFHGDLDLNVNVDHSRLMKKNLEKAGKSVEYTEYEGLDHQLPDSNVRSQMLYKIYQFLDRNMDLD